MADIIFKYHNLWTPLYKPLLAKKCDLNAWLHGSKQDSVRTDWIIDTLSQLVKETPGATNPVGITKTSYTFKELSFTKTQTYSRWIQLRKSIDAETYLKILMKHGREPRELHEKLVKRLAEAYHRVFGAPVEIDPQGESQTIEDVECHKNTDQACEVGMLSKEQMQELVKGNVTQEQLSLKDWKPNKLDLEANMEIANLKTSEELVSLLVNMVNMCSPRTIEETKSMFNAYLQMDPERLGHLFSEHVTTTLGALRHCSEEYQSKMLEFYAFLLPNYMKKIHGFGRASLERSKVDTGGSANDKAANMGVGSPTKRAADVEAPEVSKRAKLPGTMDLKTPDGKNNVKPTGVTKSADTTEAVSTQHDGSPQKCEPPGRAGAAAKPNVQRGKATEIATTNTGEHEGRRRSARTKCSNNAPSTDEPSRHPPPVKTRPSNTGMAKNNVKGNSPFGDKLTRYEIFCLKEAGIKTCRGSAIQKAIKDLDPNSGVNYDGLTRPQLFEIWESKRDAAK